MYVSVSRMPLKVNEATPLFVRIDPKEMYAKIEEAQKEAQKSAKSMQDVEKAEEKKIEGLAQIGIDDFCKVELRVAQIKECEKVKKSKKLLFYIF